MGLPGVASAARGLVEQELAHHSRIVLIERAHFADLLEEIGFQQSGVTPNEGAAETGASGNVQLLIFGQASRRPPQEYRLALRIVESPRGASCEPKRPSFLRRVQNSNRPFESVPAPADNRSCGTTRRGCIDSCRHFLHGICEVSGGGSGPRCATQSLARVAGAAYFFPEEPGAAGDAGKLARRRRVLRLGPQTLTHRGRVRARRPRPIAW